MDVESCMRLRRQATWHTISGAIATATLRVRADKQVVDSVHIPCVNPLRPRPIVVVAQLVCLNRHLRRYLPAMVKQVTLLRWF